MRTQIGLGLMMLLSSVCVADEQNKDTERVIAETVERMIAVRDTSRTKLTVTQIEERFFDLASRIEAGEQAISGGGDACISITHPGDGTEELVMLVNNGNEASLMIGARDIKEGAYSLGVHLIVDGSQTSVVLFDRGVVAESVTLTAETPLPDGDVGGRAGGEGEQAYNSKCFGFQQGKLTLQRKVSSRNMLIVFDNFCQGNDLRSLAGARHGCRRDSASWTWT